MFEICATIHNKPYLFCESPHTYGKAGRYYIEAALHLRSEHLQKLHMNEDKGFHPDASCGRIRLKPYTTYEVSSFQKFACFSRKVTLREFYAEGLFAIYEDD
jgi:hypothetical protein